MPTNATITTTRRAGSAGQAGEQPVAEVTDRAELELRSGLVRRRTGGLVAGGVLLGEGVETRGRAARPVDQILDLGFCSGGCRIRRPVGRGRAVCTTHRCCSKRLVVGLAGLRSDEAKPRPS